MVTHSISEVAALRNAKTPENAAYWPLKQFMYDMHVKLQPVVNRGEFSPASRMANRHLRYARSPEYVPAPILAEPDHIDYRILSRLIACVVPDPDERKGQPGRIGIGGLNLDVAEFPRSNLTMETIAVALGAGTLTNLHNSVPVLDAFTESHKYLNKAKTTALNKMSYDETPPAHPHSVDFVVWQAMHKALNKLEKVFVGIVASGVISCETSEMIMKQSEIAASHLRKEGSWVPPFEALLHGLSEGVKALPQGNPASKTLISAVAVARREFDVAKLFKPVISPVPESTAILPIRPVIVPATEAAELRSFLALPVPVAKTQYNH